MLEKAKDNAAAAELMRYLKSDVAHKVLRSYGYAY